MVGSERTEVHFQVHACNYANGMQTVQYITLLN